MCVTSSEQDLAVCNYLDGPAPACKSRISPELREIEDKRSRKLFEVLRRNSIMSDTDPGDIGLIGMVWFTVLAVLWNCLGSSNNSLE